MHPHILKSILWAVCLGSQAPFLWPILVGSTLPAFLLALCVLGLFLSSWDRKLRFSFTRLSGPLLCLGLAASLAAVGFSMPWLGSWGLLLSAIAFFADQSDKTGHSMLQIGFLFIGFIALPTELQIRLVDIATDSIVGTSQMILYSTATPHLADHTAFEYVGKTVQVFSFPWITWRLCFLACVVYSISRGRRWPTTLINIACASFCWYSLRFLLLSLPALLPTIPAQACLPLCLVIAVLLFLSLERGFRTLLTPVPDDAGDSQDANPIITLWNRMENPRVADEPAHTRTALVLSICLVSLLVGVLQWVGLGNTVSSSAAEVDSETRRTSSVIEES